MKRIPLMCLALSFLCASLAGLQIVFGEDTDGGKTSARPSATPDKEGEVVARIDAMIEAKWKEKGLTPSAPASDSEWIRRVYLDIIGRAPMIEETVAFLDSKDKDKRTKTIETLLASEEYSIYWAYLWGKELTGQTMGKRGALNLHYWMRENIAANTGFDKMTSALLTATGVVDPAAPDPNPAGYFLAFDNEVNNLAANISRVFLGIEIQCAQCHDHKTEHWKQTDFQSFAAFFKGTRSKKVTNDKDSADYNTWEVTDSEFPKFSKKRQGELGKKAEEKAKENPEAMEKLAIAKATPKYLDGDEVEAEDGAEARKKLAEWMTKDNDWFARTTANRIWGHYMKRGFVEPVDDFSEININSNPELLAYVARDFASHGYDLRRLMRIILMTRAYQLSSDLSANNKDDLLYYSRAYVEQLSAVQVFGALASATGAEKAGSEKMSKDKLAKTKFALLRQFTTTFEDDEGKEIESFTGTIPQALMMMNGEFVTKVASAFPGGTLHTIFKTHKSPEDRIDAMYLAALCRKPLSTERSKMLNYLNGENSTVAAYEDIFWALLNSAEFLNNH